jgi:CrcB protein
MAGADRHQGRDGCGNERDLLPIDPDLAPDDPAEPFVAPARRAPPRYRYGRAQPDILAVIAAGGMVGASARYAVARAIPVHPGHFPWATFWTNLAGSFLLGFLLVVLLERFPPTRYVRPFLGTGVLGAFTTMSTFEVETALLVKDGYSLTAGVYAFGSLAAGLALAYLGIVAGRLTPARHSERPS